LREYGKSHDTARIREDDKDAKLAAESSSSEEIISPKAAKLLTKTASLPPKPKTD
jgi:hypothetical protein